MKLHCSKILLFLLPLNILVTSYHVYSKNKPSITSHHTQTNRSLCECDTQSTNYNNDEDIKSVKEIFDRQTSERFEEYEERMQEKRQKRKEQRDKDIQKIIVKDKINKSLEQKVEKGCLVCGCGLGGVAAGVGIIGPIAINEWAKAATAAAFDLAIQEGIDAGVKAAIAKIEKISFIRFTSWVVEWPKFINESNYNSIHGLIKAIKDAVASNGETCPAIGTSLNRVCNGISANSNAWIERAAEAGTKAAADATAAVEEAELFKVTTTSSTAYSTIGYSVTAILIIVLVMIIIYLILRYRRKTKMNKKEQYTKLLNQ
ncbi:hypothetical protein PFMALIP_05817 [Plasmodium falciparum MaliPS096_E11]|uniref:Surface antigen n=1 Tax=Plasmodium falciparum MaliPS096_E11 TaxID=1036727 RepID=A0A024WHE7_PLAFA|nr:hypothetical protein PFMALIP_05817 [Plasmodium falciparum MaliPS096_E11]